MSEVNEEQEPEEPGLDDLISLTEAADLSGLSADHLRLFGLAWFLSNGYGNTLSME